MSEEVYEIWTVEDWKNVPEEGKAILRDNIDFDRETYDESFRFDLEGELEFDGYKIKNILLTDASLFGTKGKLKVRNPVINNIQVVGGEYGYLASGDREDSKILFENAEMEVKMTRTERNGSFIGDIEHYFIDSKVYIQLDDKATSEFVDDSYVEAVSVNGRFVNTSFTIKYVREGMITSSRSILFGESNQFIESLVDVELETGLVFEENGIGDVELLGGNFRDSTMNVKYKVEEPGVDDIVDTYLVTKDGYMYNNIVDYEMEFVRYKNANFNLANNREKCGNNLYRFDINIDYKDVDNKVSKDDFISKGTYIDEESEVDVEGERVKLGDLYESKKTWSSDWMNLVGDEVKSRDFYVGRRI